MHAASVLPVEGVLLTCGLSGGLQVSSAQHDAGHLKVRLSGWGERQEGSRRSSRSRLGSEQLPEWILSGMASLKG